MSTNTVHIDKKMVELQTVNEDLRNERMKCTFNQEELTNFIDGGAENTDKRRKIGILYNILHCHDIFYDIRILNNNNNIK